MFLSEEDISELTGIGSGRGGSTKHELQCAFLRHAGIPFIQNARGRPIVARAYFENGRMATTQTPSTKTTWQPAGM